MGLLESKYLYLPNGVLLLLLLGYGVIAYILVKTQKGLNFITAKKSVLKES